MRLAQVWVASQNRCSSTRHVSSCASQYTEHQHKFSLTYFSCVTFVYLSDSRPVVHASIYPLWRSTAGWHFYGTPTSHRLWARKDRAQQDPVQDDNEEIGVKPLSCSQSSTNSAYDSAESIATPPDSDLEDEQLRKMLASPPYTEVSGKPDAESAQKREANAQRAQAYHSWRESLMTKFFSRSRSFRETWCSVFMPQWIESEHVFEKRPK